MTYHLRHLRFVPLVYFVRAEALELIKIGKSVDFPTRLKTLTADGPDTLRPLGIIRHDDNAAAARAEYALHQRFAKYKDHNEWFRPVARLLNFIEKSAEKLPLEADWEGPDPQLPWTDRPMPEPLLKPDDVEREYTISAATIEQMARDGNVRSICVGPRAIRFLRTELEQDIGRTKT